MMTPARLVAAWAAGMIVLSPAWSQGISDSAAQSLRESAQRVDVLLKAEEARLESKVRRDQPDQAGQKDTIRVSTSASDTFEVLAIYGTPDALKIDLLVNGLPSLGLQEGAVVKGWRVADISAQSSCVRFVKASASTKSLNARGSASSASRSFCWDGTALAIILSSEPDSDSVSAPPAPNMPLPPPPVSSVLPPGATEPRGASFVVQSRGN